MVGGAVVGFDQVVVADRTGDEFLRGVADDFDGAAADEGGGATGGVDVAVGHAGHLAEEAVELAAAFAELGFGGLAFGDVGFEQALGVAEFGGAFVDLLFDEFGAAAHAVEIGPEQAGEEEAAAEDEKRGGVELSGEPTGGRGVVAAPGAAADGEGVAVGGERGQLRGIAHRRRVGRRGGATAVEKRIGVGRAG